MAAARPPPLGWLLGGDSIGGGVAGRRPGPYIHVTVSHAGVHVCVYVLFSGTPGILKRNERKSGAN